MSPRRALDPPASSAEREWLSPADICRELAVPRKTWDRWVALGRAPRCKRLPNGRLRIRRVWLEEWIDGLPEHGRAT